MINYYWYDVCDDYSLQIRNEQPPYLDGMESTTIDEGTAYYEDSNEGPLYLSSLFGDLDGKYIDEWY